LEEDGMTSRGGRFLTEVLVLLVAGIGVLGTLLLKLAWRSKEHPEEW
jgi:formate-dependent nitrite reductase membrane component NrfD